MANIKLISFSICPFVHRAAIALQEKGADYDIEYIDLRDKPEWFLKISPRGKVPVLRVGDDSMFESNAITEYLDETTEGASLVPTNPVHRARDRAWATFMSEELFAGGWTYESAKDADAMAAGEKKMKDAFAILEGEMQGRSFLSGDGTSFGFADVAVAPVFFRVHHWATRYSHPLMVSDFPAVRAWHDKVIERPSLAAGVPSSWADDYQGLLSGFGSIAVA